jgi:hypothetical protein
MKYDHPNITVEEPKPGAFVIAGHRPASFFIPEVGHYAPPGECYIGPEIPADLLRAIADAKDGGRPAADLDTDLDSQDALLARILGKLREDDNGKMRLGDLAAAVAATPTEVKALAGQGHGFELGHAGWVTLNAGGEA